MSAPVAIIHGANSSIGREVAAGLQSEQIEVLPLEAGASIADFVQVHRRVDYLFNCFAPTAETTTDEVFDYPRQLHARCSQAAQAMADCQAQGAIVNQWFTGTLHAGTPLESPLLLGKGALTGATRQICCAFGKSGLRINTIQAGLTQMDENEGLVTAQTMARKPPVGRWATPAEVAKFMLFLALRNGYMTGQVICFDGGLTAGNTGT